MFNIATAFKEIANGDWPAENFLNRVYSWTQKLDDLLDQDQPILVEGLIQSHYEFVESIASNEFFQKNRESFLSLIMVAGLAWSESERLKRSENVIDKIGSQVLKSQYQDIFYFTAFLTGGFRHAVAMSRKYREFSFDEN